MVSRRYYAQLLREGALVCTKCGRNISEHERRCAGSSPMLKPTKQAKSKLAGVLESFGYKRVLHEEMSGVASDLYVLIHHGVHRAQLSHDGKQVSVLLPGHYELYRTPGSLAKALAQLFGPNIGEA